MRRLTAFFLLSAVKVLSKVFFPGKFQWITPRPEDPFRKARLMVLLNHTSLYEPLFMQYLSFGFLWHLAGHMNVPGADVTLARPIVGSFYRLMIPNVHSITRKKDESWEKYLGSIDKDSVVLIAPEGRMKRPNGLDKFGKPMTVRGGVADIIEEMEGGAMILCLSGGLHHVQEPGQTFPRLFKTIRMNLAYVDLTEYKSKLPGSPRERKIQIVHDLQRRLENDCP